MVSFINLMGDVALSWCTQILNISVLFTTSRLPKTPKPPNCQHFYLPPFHHIYHHFYLSNHQVIAIVISFTFALMIHGHQVSVLCTYMILIILIILSLYFRVVTLQNYRLIKANQNVKCIKIKYKHFNKFHMDFTC